MLQLTYISSAVRDITAGAVDEILATSRRNNAAAGVTGLLLYDGRRFLQALEGDAAAVEATYDRIRIDPRHRAMVMLSSRDITERMFGNWAMAAERAAVAAAGTVTDQVDALTAGLADPNLRETFRGFARVRAAA